MTDESDRELILTIREFTEAFQRIGTALGLEGRYMVHFGHEQILARAREVSARMQFAETAVDAGCGSSEWH